jgi:mono/diheme cytochrome c family protein
MRTTGLALAALLALAVPAPASASSGDHANAVGALGDVRAAVAEIVRIEDGYAVGHGAYVRAAHRVLNALVGRRDDGYVRAFGDPGDGVGTLGHLDRMLDQTASFAWTPAVEGAKANLLAAAENVQTALGEREMEDYQADLTHALANLALVVGRSSQEGVFGGISGALGTTALGVPDGAALVSGCALPARAPAYGVVDGRLAYVALPRSAASAAVPGEIAVSRVVVRGGEVVLYTAAAHGAAALCRRVAHAANAPRLRVVRRFVVAASAATVPALYTAAQAHAGKAVYVKSCLQCHSADLQGSAGPAVAGNDFLQNAQRNKWSLSDMRTTVFQNMPFSNPGSLTPTQYANVMAFLLASSCYPAGSKPFPSADSPAFSKIKLGPVAGAKPSNPKLGTCTVK